MHKFRMDQAMADSDKLIKELYTALQKETDKFMDRHRKADHRIVLTSLQSACLNYFLKVTHALAANMTDKSKQLDYMDVIKTNMDAALEEVRTALKVIGMN